MNPHFGYGSAKCPGWCPIQTRRHEESWQTGRENQVGVWEGRLDNPPPFEAPLIAIFSRAAYFFSTRKFVAAMKSSKTLTCRAEMSPRSKMRTQPDLVLPGPRMMPGLTKLCSSTDVGYGKYTAVRFDVGQEAR